MAKTYRKTKETYDTAPVIITPSARDLDGMKVAILAFIDTGTKTYDEIEVEILTTQAYASDKGATGTDVLNTLNSLEDDVTLQTSNRVDKLFIESVIE